MLSDGLLQAAGVIIGLMAVIWCASLVYRDASLVDRVWGLGFVAVAWFVWSEYGQFTARNGLLLTLVTLWGLRLSGYLSLRNWGHGEDYRYKAMRERHGRAFPLVSLVTVFGLQGVVMWGIASPLAAALSTPVPPDVGLVELAGATLWGVGFVFESVGDAQLARFKADPANRGKVMDRGLWRYTRHPNYFGDALVWWGLWLVCARSPYAAYLVFSPLLMTVFLLKVSGVAMLERTITERRPAYADYIRRTSAFLPWPPRPAKSGTE